MPKVRGKKDHAYLKIVVSGLFSLLFIAALVFVSAGRMDYWQGWAFALINFISVLVIASVFVGKTELIKERMHPGPGTKWWDKVFWALYAPMFFVIMIIASLDAGRFGWTGQLPLFIFVIGCVLYVLSVLLQEWAKWVNRFFSTVVRIQKDRGHQVVQDGPYRFVRHPGYVAGILMGTSTPLVLGSLWALIPAIIMAILLIMRTYLEDRTLQKELPGYAAYAKKVRYRLLPGVW